MRLFPFFTGVILFLSLTSACVTIHYLSGEGVRVADGIERMGAERGQRHSGGHARERGLAQR